MDLSPIIYCHCAHAQVVPREVKSAVLRALCESSAPFEAVADLCELAARRDPALQRLASARSLKIAACHPRAVQWLFAAAGAPVSAGQVEVLNMRLMPANDVAKALLDPRLQPNLSGSHSVAPHADPEAEPTLSGPGSGAVKP
jgi:hypothetical protein